MLYIIIYCIYYYYILYIVIIYTKYKHNIYIYIYEIQKYHINDLPFKIQAIVSVHIKLITLIALNLHCTWIKQFEFKFVLVQVKLLGSLLISSNIYSNWSEIYFKQEITQFYIVIKCRMKIIWISSQLK